MRLSEDGKVEGSVRKLAMKRLAGKSDPTADQVEKWTPEKMIPELLSVKVRVGPSGRRTFSLTQGSVFQDRLRHLPYPVVEQRERCYSLTDRRRIVQINHRVQREFFRSDTLLARAKR